MLFIMYYIYIIIILFIMYYIDIIVLIILPGSSKVGPESSHHLGDLHVGRWIIGTESAHPE